MKSRTAMILFRPHLVRGMVLGWMLAAAPSAAQPAPSDDPYQADGSEADTLFNDGMALMKKGNFAEACPKLKDSVGINPRNAAKFRLAECYESIGRKASAWVLFVNVADEAKADGKTDREKLARERADALEPKVPRMTLVVSQSVASLPGARIELDGATVEPSDWNKAVPVDPGAHTVSVSATGKKTWQQSIHLLDGTPLKVEVPALGDEAATTAASEPAKSSKAAPKPAQSAAKTPPRSGTAGRGGERRSKPSLPPKWEHPPGVVFLSVESQDAPVAVYRETEERPALVCRAPCDQIVDGRSGKFFLDHDGVRVNTRFKLDERWGSVKIKVRTLPNNARVATGIIGVVLGSAAIVATPVLGLSAGFRNNDPAITALFWPTFIGGALIGFPMSIIGIVFGRGRYRIESYHIESSVALVPSILPGPAHGVPMKGAVINLSGVF